jgi:hypothetical protein
MVFPKHKLSVGNAPEIPPDNPAFLDICYLARYRIWLAGYPAGFFLQFWEIN